MNEPTGLVSEFSSEGLTLSSTVQSATNSLQLSLQSHCEAPLSIKVPESRNPGYSNPEPSGGLNSDAAMPELESFPEPPLQDLPVGSEGSHFNEATEEQDQVESEPSTLAKSFSTSEKPVEQPPPSGARSPHLLDGSSLRRANSGSRRLSGSRRRLSSRRITDSRRISDPRRLSQKEDPNQRIVYINNPDRTNEKFNLPGNKVRTSKYTFLSFIPRNLFEQFHRFAYIYFLLIVILNQIPQLAVFGRTASLFPLVLVLVITAIKDGYEDWGRHRSDRKENNRLFLVHHDGHYIEKKWKNIRVGEMVKIFANQTVPCDMVLLATSDPSGVAYVETLNLDGESNLKSRYARQETSAKHPELHPLAGTLYCELPNRNIYDFSAYMSLGAEQISLVANNIILRGCEVKNTSWVIGVVVYAGRDTKAMLNSSGAQSKRSRLEHHMNRETGWLVVFLVVICFVGGLGMGLWVSINKEWLPIIPFYKQKDTYGGNYRFSGTVGEGIFAFLSCVIRFQIMIPLSLYISMELVRLGQSYFMTRDMEMFHEGSNSKFQCRALNINEDLGQIKYLFSDKTGTLTENKMEFDSASIDGIDFSDAKISIEPTEVKIEGSIKPEDTQLVEGAFTIPCILFISVDIVNDVITDVDIMCVRSMYPVFCDFLLHLLSRLNAGPVEVRVEIMAGSHCPACWR